MTGSAAFGPYRLEELLGRGGMGEVWRALDTRKDRRVAVKVLGAWLDPADDEFTRRFRRESALAARLNAPNIVPIHDYGEIGGRLFIEMPLIAGTDLGTLVARDGLLPPGRVIGIVDQVARALGAAHRAGLVHRDVKPSNILVTEIEGDDHVYLIDFGIVRDLASPDRTLSGVVTGTPAYMAPERFDGHGDHRADIYALGCVLHEALTRFPPYSAPGPAVMMNRHFHAIPPRPSSQRPDVPVALDEVVARALAKNPEHRYGSAVELATAARTALTRPTAPRPPIPAAGPAVPQVPPARPPAGAATAAAPRRRRIALAGAAALLLTIAVVAGVLVATRNVPGSGQATPGPTPQPTAITDPAVWADRSCGALLSYYEPLSRRPTFDGLDLPGIQKRLSDYLNSVATGLATAQSQLRDVGPSPVAGGDQFARSYQDLLSRTAGTVQRAKNDVDSVDPNDVPAFQRNLAAAQQELETIAPVQGLNRTGATPELDAAVSTAPTCIRINQLAGAR